MHVGRQDFRPGSVDGLDQLPDGFARLWRAGELFDQVVVQLDQRDVQRTQQAQMANVICKTRKREAAAQAVETIHESDGACLVGHHVFRGQLQDEARPLNAVLEQLLFQPGGETAVQE